MTITAPPLSDADLTAYLDGEADNALIAQVQAGGDAVARRLAALDVPMDVLRAGLSVDAIGAPDLPTHVLRRRASLAWPASVAAAFVAGILLTSVLRPASPPDWIDAVASYQALYVAQTVEGALQPVSTTDAVIGQIETAFDVDLTRARDVDGLTLVRAQMLGIGDAPLLQIAYRTADGTPMAFCLTRVDGADRDATTGTYHGLAGTSWVKDRVGYLLIWGGDAALVEQLAAGLV